jgi:2-oxo-3-hexenedioate decarboxylase
MTDLASWAEYLLSAERAQSATAPITDSVPGLNAEEGYAIQRLIIDAKVASGERIVGAKAGLTSKAKQLTMRVDQPIFGILTSSMMLDTEQPLVCSELIHPRVEPEIVFILAEDLDAPKVSGHDVLDATAWVTAGLEVIDSRYADFRFTHADVVADNTSASRFVIGTALRRPEEIPDLALVGCNLSVNGVIVTTAAGAAILGDPAGTVALLANWLTECGSPLRKGDVILSGGMTNAFPIAPGGHITSTLGRIGSVTIRGV